MHWDIQLAIHCTILHNTSVLTFTYHSSTQDSPNETGPVFHSTHPLGLFNDSSSSEGESSFDAPAYSPVSVSSSSSSDHEPSMELEAEPCEGVEASWELGDDCESTVDQEGHATDVQQEEQTTNHQEEGQSTDLQQEADLQQEGHVTKSYGYKFVGDNVDKNTKPSRQRAEIKGQSLHYFHSYAEKDRVPIGSLSDKPPPRCDPDPAKFLPSSEEIHLVKEDMHVLLSR